MSIPELTTAARLTEQIKNHTEGNWIHNYEVLDDGTIEWPENLQYRTRILEGVFGSLFVNRSVLVLDEASGVYPMMIARAGANSVSGCSANAATCALMDELWNFVGMTATTIHSRMVAFYSHEPYVESAYHDSHDFLVVFNQIWRMYGAAGGSFDAVVEACAYLVADGIVFDWTNAEWAKPPPPAEYNRDALCDALRKKFEHVIVFPDWLVIAVGKLPRQDEGEGAPSVIDQPVS